MKRIIREKRAWIHLLGPAVVILVAAAAQAQTTTAPPTDPAPPASVQPAEQAAPQAADATAKANEKLAKIRERGATLDLKQRQSFEERLDKEKQVIDLEGTSKGDGTVAERLAGDLGVSADVLAAEKLQYQTGWGDLTIAHLLMGNGTDVTLDQLFLLRKEGQGWGQIAHGMDLNLGQLLSAVKSQGKVATGQEKADGKMASIRGQEMKAEAKAKAAEAKAKGAEKSAAAKSGAMKQAPAAKTTPPAQATPPAGGGGHGRSGK
ncbi:MAG TPA: hypothetical protein VFM17_01195 [Candidatus Eisenbacteria bacterium]|nr:hypothetical protein [Candidatus Eisenbacteria bacterium]